MDTKSKFSEFFQDEFAKNNLERLLQSKKIIKFINTIKQGKPTKGLRINFNYNANGKISNKGETNDCNTARLIIYPNQEKKPDYEFIKGKPTPYANDTLNKTLELYKKYIKGKQK